jgi:hypothetical protein
VVIPEELWPVPWTKGTDGGGGKYRWVYRDVIDERRDEEIWEGRICCELMVQMALWGDQLVVVALMGCGCLAEKKYCWKYHHLECRRFCFRICRLHPSHCLSNRQSFVNNIVD